MADAPPVTKLVDMIETHDASTVAAISALTDRCLVDTRNRTLFDVAILSDNAEVIALLASDRDALEFSAPVDAKIEEPIKHTVAMHEIEVPISKLEAHLQNSFGEHLTYGRTPLHTACRAGNTSAMETLLAAGAKTNVKDAIGLAAPELAYFGHGEKGLCDFLTCLLYTSDAADESSSVLLSVGGGGV